jgi:F-type H+-transporting ATPase subunit gamma
MRRASDVQKESNQLTTVRDLTGVFESIASTQVSKIKDKVAMSKDFFDLLWQRYSLIRVDPGSRITERALNNSNGRSVIVCISAEAGLSGDIDQRLIEVMLKDYDKNTSDIVVLGSHGAAQLKQQGIEYIRLFKIPESDYYIDVSPVIKAIQSYSKITIYYEAYISLGVQEIKKMDLISTLQTMSRESITDKNLITAQDTIFEPSLDEIADLMESAMMTLALSQTILESSLAQDASRFNAMALAKKRAWEMLNLYRLEYHRAKRSEVDRRSREVMITLKRKKRVKKHV